MSKHTKGSWTVIPREKTITIDSNTDFGTIAELETTSDCLEMQMANAKLMAAAPELLEALDNLNTAIGDYLNRRTWNDRLENEKLINKHQRIAYSIMKKATE
jgi:hypothetical protein